MDTKESLDLKARQQENAELQDQIEALRADLEAVRKAWKEVIDWNRFYLTEVKALRVENEALKVALHDAIRAPKGVVPGSAEWFYDAERQEKA